MERSELEAIKEATKTFFQKELAPNILEFDDREEFPIEVYKKFTKTGLHVVNFPETYGGADSTRALAVIGEEMARVDPGFALSFLVSSHLFGYNVNSLGTEEQKKKYLTALSKDSKIGCWALTEPDSGSDAVSIKTKAEAIEGGYILNGSKTFITNAPIADFFIVFTRESGNGTKGMTAFILEREMEGLELSSPLKKMGNKTSPTGQIFLKNCRVSKDQVLGEAGNAFFDMKKSLDLERLVFSGVANGVAKEALDRTVKYTLERQQFGKHLAEFQLIQAKVGDMASKIEMAQAYSEKAFDKFERGEKIHMETAVMKTLGVPMVLEIVDEAVQALGGNGYMKEYFVEKLYRDARLFAIGGGTTEINKLIVAKEVYKKALNF